MKPLHVDAPPHSRTATAPADAHRWHHVLNAAAMVGVLLWDVHAYLSCHRYQPYYKWFGFLSRWTLALVALYLVGVAWFAEESGAPRRDGAAARWLWRAQSVALPASIAVVPLYWGQVFVEGYADKTHPLSSYFVHGFNALVMLWDFALSERAWRFGDLAPVLFYGFMNMGFMWIYYSASGCPDCDLDLEGHPYVYSVVDWRRPRAAAAACLGAILIPVPLLSAGLTVLSNRLGNTRAFPSYRPR